MGLRPLPDLGVVKEADAFTQASIFLSARPEAVMLIPAVVNAAFALELYLKSMNMEWQVANPDALDGKKAWLASRTALQMGHMPSKLYGVLEQSLKNDLEKRYRERFQKEHPQSLEDALKTYDSLFQDWRYIFEGRGASVDTWSLHELLGFFSDVLNAMPQRWIQQRK